MEFMTYFNNHVTQFLWRTHATAFHQWEITHHITRKKKKSYRKSLRSARTATNTLTSFGRIQGPSNNTTSRDPPISRPTCHIYTLTPRQHNIVSDCHAPDVKQYIYLISSNYLHSGHWTTHLSSSHHTLSVSAWSFYGSLGFNGSSLGLSLN